MQPGIDAHPDMADLVMTALEQVRDSRLSKLYHCWPRAA
jgi:hypothetical protein